MESLWTERFPCAGKGRRPPDKSARPLPPLPLEHLSNPRVGGQAGGGGGVPLSSPSPSSSSSPASPRPSRPGHARSRTHTPAGLTIAHTHIHTQQQTKGLDTPVPSRPSGRRGPGIPLPAPLQGKLRAASCGGEGDPASRREGTKTLWALPAPQESRGPPGRPLRASGWPLGCGYGWGGLQIPEISG